MAITELGELPRWYDKVFERVIKDIQSENPVYIRVYKDGDLRAVALKSGRHAIKVDGAKAKLADALITKLLPNLAFGSAKTRVIRVPAIYKLVKLYVYALKNVDKDETYRRLYELAREIDPEAVRPRPNSMWKIIKSEDERKKMILAEALKKAAAETGIANPDNVYKAIMEGKDLRELLGTMEIKFEFIENVDRVDHSVITTVISNVYRESIEGRKVRCSPSKHPDCRCENGKCWRYKTPEEVVDEIIDRVVYSLTSGATVGHKLIFDAAKLTVASKNVVIGEKTKINIKHNRVFKGAVSKLGKDLSKIATRYKLYKEGVRPEDIKQLLATVKETVLPAIKAEMEAAEAKY